ncbi:hypothetical protein ACWIWA_06155, partial [Ursidibacter arcticus]
FIDFVIIIEHQNKKILLPIELDGFWKFQDYHSFNDTLERQNDLINQFGFLLRYTNKKMLSNPQSIIDEISEFIRNTHKNIETKTLAERNKKQAEQVQQERLNTLLSEISVLKNREEINRKQNIKEQKNTEELQKEIEQIKKAIFSLQKNSISSKEKSIPSESVTRKIQNGHITLKSILLLLIGISILAIGYYWFKQAEFSHQKNSLHKENVYCGRLVEIRAVDFGIFLNFDKRYPNHSFSVKILNKDLEKMNNAEIVQYENTYLCVTGNISSHMNKPIIEITEQSQLFKK